MRTSRTRWRAVCSSAASVALSAMLAGAAPYAAPGFAAPLDAGMSAFYRRDFTAARAAFAQALAAAPGEPLAIAFYDAAAAQRPEDLAALLAAEQDAATAHPRDPIAHVRLAYADLFGAPSGEATAADARAELDRALALAPGCEPALTGLGVLEEREGSAHRAKTALVEALAHDPDDLLAREELAQIDQLDLREPQAALALVADVPNRVPAYADIDFRIASILEDLHQYDAAIVYATRGLEIDVGRVGEAGRHGDVLLGRVYLAEHRPEDARRVLRASIAAGTDVVSAGVLLKSVDALDRERSTR